MSKKLVSLMLIAGIAMWVVFATGPGMTPTASGQQILPGGRPAKIRSYVHEVGSQPPGAVIIPALTDVNGFIITDIVMDELNSAESPRLVLMQGGAPLLYAREKDGEYTMYVRFESGLHVAPGEAVTGYLVHGSGAIVTISGYTY